MSAPGCPAVLGSRPVIHVSAANLSSRGFFIRICHLRFVHFPNFLVALRFFIRIGRLHLLLCFKPWLMVILFPNFRNRSPGCVSG